MRTFLESVVGVVALAAAAVVETIEARRRRNP
jgi:hypothetical protein